MYIVFYDKATNRIIRVVKKDKYFVDFGCSSNIDFIVTDEKPTGEYVEQ